MNRSLVKQIRRLRADESGSATVEALIWIPVFVYFLVFILDTSFIFFGKAQALRYIQDGNRALTVGALPDVDAVELYIKTAMSEYAPSAIVNTEIVDGMIVSTSMEIPASELMVIGTVPVFETTKIRITASHFLEQ